MDYQVQSEVLKKLNDIRINIRDVKSKDYQEMCKKLFSDKKYDEIFEDLGHMMKHFQIEYIPKPIEMLNIRKIVSELRNGNIAITDYGRTLLDIRGTSSVYVQELNQSKEKYIREFEKIENGISKIKDRIYPHIFTIMGIFVVIITLLFQSIKLISSNEFIEQCFGQKLLTVITIYSPLVLVLILIIVGSKSIQKYFFNKKKKDKK